MSSEMRVEVIVAAGVCPRCHWTMKALDKAGVAYTVLTPTDLTESELEEMRRKYPTAPVVRTPVGTWAGALTPEQARQLAQTLTLPAAQEDLGSVA